MMHRLIFLVAAYFLFIPAVFSQDISTEYSHVPEWAKRAVWYEIFTDRFFNGDATNDPVVDDILGSWPYDPPNHWRVSPWTSDWYRLQSWEAGDTNVHQGFYDHVYRRRYGGDLQGILNKLDYLSRLGVTALCLGPVFESPSMDKLDATMYHHIDNNFGPDPLGDRTTWSRENPGEPATWRWTSADKLFLKLIKEAHKRHMRVVIDAEFTRVGKTFWAFEDVRKNRGSSIYKDWFTVAAFDHPATPASEFDHAGWIGEKELPELREDSLGLVPKVREHIAAAVRRWMDPDGDGSPSDGIDGWRLDVADSAEKPYWLDFRKLVRSINAEAFIARERRWTDVRRNAASVAAPRLAGAAFDAVADIRLAREAYHFFIDRQYGITATEFERRLQLLRAGDRENVNMVLFNLSDTRGMGRLSSRTVNSDMPVGHGARPIVNSSYKIRKPTREEARVQMLAVLFQMTYLDAPMIRYGDEVGIWGGGGPDAGKPMLWANFIYEKESYDPFGADRPADPVAADLRLFAYYKFLISLRNSHDALSIGSYRNVVVADSAKLFGYLRSSGSEQFLVVLNAGDQSREVSIPMAQLESTRVIRELIEKNGFNVQHDSLQFLLGPISGNIFELGK